MDIANLQAFTAVATSASFSHASELLHLTQPAISKRVANLEAELEVRLFDRIGRRVLLTEAGRTLLPRAQRILSELEDSRQALRNLTGQVSGSMILATSHHIGLHRLPPLLREFSACYPNVQLDMRFTDSELACDDIARGDAELAIITLPPQPRPGLRCIPIWDDPLAIVVNHSHALANKSKSILAPEVLAGYPAILPGEITFTRRIVAQFFAQYGIQLRIAFTTNYLETIKMMVAVGLGWSVLPKTMLDNNTTAEITAVNIVGFSVQRTLGAVHHSGQTLSNAAQAMLAILQKNSAKNHI